MSSDAALVERMSNAVRAAYKAMEILKAENQSLKAENQTLRDQLSKFQPNLPSSRQATLEKVTVDIPRDTKESDVPIRPSATTGEGMALQRISQQKPDQLTATSAILIEGEEVGTNRFKFKSFSNAPDAKRLAEHLKELSVDNIHFIASTLAGQSPEALCKALSITISSYIQANGTARNSACLAEIPVELMLKLDQLVSVVGSICSRGDSGLVKAKKLLEVLRKVILGAVRFQLCAPHYATVMGVLRVARNKSPPLQRDPGTTTGPQSAEPVLATTEPQQSLQTEQQATTEAAPGDRKQWISSLSTLFGLDSSDESGSDEDARDGSDQGDDTIYTAEGWPGDDEAYSAEQSEEEEEDSIEGRASDSDDSAVQDCALAPKPMGDAEGPADPSGDVRLGDGECDTEAAEHRAAGSSVGHLHLACRVYVLLATLLRTALHQELVLTLDQMRLVTVHNFSESCAIGVIAVFGSPRYGREYRQDVVQALLRLLRVWLISLTANSEGGDDGSTPKAIRGGVLSVLKRFDRHTSSAASAVRSGHEMDAVALIADAENILRRSASDEVPPDDDDCTAACRAVGFWGAAHILSTKASTGHRLSHGALFETLGLDRVAAQATTWCTLLRAWDPATSPAAEGSNLLERAPALTAFLQSEDFFSSCLQGSVIAALKSMDVSPLKLTAQDALVEVFAAQRVKGLSSASENSTATTTAMVGATRAVHALKNLFQSVYSTEYDEAEGGWRTGLSGDGHRLQSRLDNRRAVALVLLGKLSGVRHFTSSAMMVVLKPSLYWQHLSSCPSRKLLEYAQFVDHCAQHVFTNAWGVNGSDKPDDAEATVKKLYAVCADIVAALALAAVENVTAVAVGSVRGLLRALGGHPSLGAVRGVEEAVNLVHAVDRFLTVIPAPWAGSCRADVHCELQLCSRAVLTAAQTSHASEALRLLRLHSCARMLRAAQELPVFVINLDKRTDRLWTSLIMLNEARISAVRVLAYDGTGEGGAPSSSAAEMFHRSFGGANAVAQGPDASNVTDSAPSLRRRRDDYIDIPERDVALTWDSTINAMFDVRCAAHTAVIATPSERACAASHLKVWRAIADLCGIKHGQSARAGGALKLLKPTEHSSARDPLAPHSEAEMYRALKGDTFITSITSTTAQPDTDALHRRVFPDAETGSDYFVVLEDDAAFPQQSLADLRATIRELMATLPADVDILYLGGLLPKAAPAFKLHRKKGEPFFHVNYVWTLQAYVLRRRAVEVLLSKLPIWAPVDNFVSSLIYNKELKACIVKDKLTQKPSPLSALVRKEDSDIRPSGRTLQVVRKRTGPAPGDNGSGKNHRKRGRKV